MCDGQKPAQISNHVGSSGILKAKQKLGVNLKSDKLGGINFTKFLKLGGSIDIDFSKNLVCKV